MLQERSLQVTAHPRTLPPSAREGQIKGKGAEGEGRGRRGGRKGEERGRKEVKVL